MDESKNKVWKNKISFKIMIGIIILLVITVPIILYLIIPDSKGEPLFSTNGLLSYYGALIAFLGTVILALVALHQNKELVKINNRMQHIEMAENKAEYGIFNAANVVFTYKDGDSNNYYFHFDITIKTIIGYGFDIILKWEKALVSKETANNVIKNMFLNKEMLVFQTNYQTNHTVSHYAKELHIENFTPIPKKVIDESNSIVIKLTLQHRDIYNAIHNETVHVAYNIAHQTSQLEYHNYHVLNTDKNQA